MVFVPVINGNLLTQNIEVQPPKHVGFYFLKMKSVMNEVSQKAQNMKLMVFFRPSVFFTACTGIQLKVLDYKTWIFNPKNTIRKLRLKM